MSGQLKIDGAALPISGMSAPYVFDPRDQTWGKEGDEWITHSRKKTSLAQMSMELFWPVVPASHASKLMAYYFAVIVPADCNISTLTVPPRSIVDTGSLATWKEYNGIDGEPIIVDEPTFEYAGPSFKNIRWRFHGLCHALES